MSALKEYIKPASQQLLDPQEFEGFSGVNPVHFQVEISTSSFSDFSMGARYVDNNEHMNKGRVSAPVQLKVESESEEEDAGPTLLHAFSEKFSKEYLFKPSSSLLDPGLNGTMHTTDSFADFGLHVSIDAEAELLVDKAPGEK